MASPSPSPKSTLSLKLIIDPKANKVLFADAAKDFVDFLFSLLCMPFGAAVNLLKEAHSLGSIQNLHRSMETLNVGFMEPIHEKKDLLLKPRLPLHALNISLSLPDTAPEPPVVKQIQLYRCISYGSTCNRYVTELQNSKCSLGHYMTEPVHITNAMNNAKPNVQKGYVKGGNARYIVMDDLSVSPIMSTDSCFDALIKMNVNDVGAIQRKVVEVGANEALQLLNVSLHSNSKEVLTNVFLIPSEVKHEEHGITEDFLHV